MSSEAFKSGRRLISRLLYGHTHTVFDIMHSTRYLNTPNVQYVQYEHCLMHTLCTICIHRYSI